MGKLQLKMMCVQVIPPQVTQTKTWRKLQNYQGKLMKCHFGAYWQVRLLVWNMPANSDGGFEHVSDLRRVCAFLVH
jgi:hypothetical protein